MHAQALDGPLDVEDLDDESVAGDEAGVSCLAAGLGVERGLREDQLDLVAGGGMRHRAAAAEDAADLGFAVKFRVAGEDGLALGQQFLEGAEVSVRALLALGVGLGALALLQHERAEFGLVHLEAGFFGHFQRQVDRETVGVVQGKGVGAGQRNWPAALESFTASSRRAVPEAMVRRKAFSSA